ncbi:MAG: hypothetical protein BGO26_12930 [Actinobacteria bacterium 69-20]|jgi:hypothetical protein|nr:antitoxin [Actinomycetota bacterium]OJV23585.1 MAG: hypothetical protein BGO26_12930 [Actinobacteria bacterium 69-20]
MRTTLDIDSSVLKQLKDYQRGRGESLGALASELLAKALAEETQQPRPLPLEWISRPMGARTDLEDRDTVERLSGAQYGSAR